MKSNKNAKDKREGPLESMYIALSCKREWRPCNDKLSNFPSCSMGCEVALYLSRDDIVMCDAVKGEADDPLESEGRERDERI